MNDENSKERGHSMSNQEKDAGQVQEFEAWLESTQRPLWDTLGATQLMLLAWQASRQATLKECAEICDNLKQNDYPVDVRHAAEAIRERFSI